MGEGEDIFPNDPTYVGSLWSFILMFRSKLICEDSDLQMERILEETRVDVKIPTTDKLEEKKPKA